ncbi:hypothetical protein Hanom_Chr03g00248431 [Helianthus anomalus]
MTMVVFLEMFFPTSACYDPSALNQDDDDECDQHCDYLLKLMELFQKYGWGQLNQDHTHLPLHLQNCC